MATFRKMGRDIKDVVGSLSSSALDVTKELCSATEVGVQHIRYIRQDWSNYVSALAMDHTINGELKKVKAYVDLLFRAEYASHEYINTQLKSVNVAGLSEAQVTELKMYIKVKFDEMGAAESNVGSTANKGFVGLELDDSYVKPAQESNESSDSAVKAVGDFDPNQVPD